MTPVSGSLLELKPQLRTQARALQGIMIALLAVYVILLITPLGSARWSAPRDLWLTTAVLVLGITACAMRAVLVAKERAAWICFAAAAACWTTANVYFVAVAQAQRPMPTRRGLTSDTLPSTRSHGRGSRCC